MYELPTAPIRQEKNEKRNESGDTCNDYDHNKTEQITESRINEIRGFIEIDSLKIFEPSNVSSSTLIFGSKFIDKAKKSTEELYRKSRLAAQNHGDEFAASTATKSATVQRITRRLLLSIAAFV